MPRPRRSDPEQDARIRSYAADGISVAAAAQRLGIPPSTVWQRARAIGVTFGVGRNGVRRSLLPTEVKSTVPKAGDFASPDLRAQIEAAKAEAPTARPFRGGGW